MDKIEIWLFNAFVAFVDALRKFWLDVCFRVSFSLFVSLYFIEITIAGGFGMRLFNFSILRGWTYGFTVCILFVEFTVFGSRCHKGNFFRADNPPAVNIYEPGDFADME